MYSQSQLDKWFRKVEGSELIFGRRYLIDKMFIGKYIVYYCFGYDVYRLFQLTPYYSHEYSDKHAFYEWIPKAQEKMERRVLHQILRSILNDPYFEW